MTDEQAKIGRWLGIAHRVGSDMTYWILTKSGKLIARSTKQHITTTTNMATDAIKNTTATFDAKPLDDENFHIDLPSHVLYLQDNDEVVRPDLPAIPLEAEYGDMMQDPKYTADDIEFETFDQYLGAEFLVNLNGETAMATVSTHAKDNEGNAIGKRNPNPLLDTREYKCAMEDGPVYQYNANAIADNIYSRCDDEGRRHAVLQEIIDHTKDRTAVDMPNGGTQQQGKGGEIRKR